MRNGFFMRILNDDNGTWSAFSTAKLGLHPKKVLLCIWWDYKGIIHHKVLEYGDTISADKYYQQFDRLNTSLLQKRPALVNRHRVIIQHDNATPHNAKVTQQIINTSVLTHPPYSPDLGFSDNYLFRSLQHFLNGKNFENAEAIKNKVSAYFNAKDPSWFEKGFKDLLKRWETVIDTNGEYIIDWGLIYFLIYKFLFFIKISHFQLDDLIYTVPDMSFRDS